MECFQTSDTHICSAGQTGERQCFQTSGAHSGHQTRPYEMHLQHMYERTGLRCHLAGGSSQWPHTESIQPRAPVRIQRAKCSTPLGNTRSRRRRACFPGQSEGSCFQRGHQLQFINGSASTAMHQLQCPSVGGAAGPAAVHIWPAFTFGLPLTMLLMTMVMTGQHHLPQLK